MRRLWFWPIDPLARTVRLALGEKGWSFEPIVIKPWVSDLELAALAPGACAPALLDTDAEVRTSAIGTLAICEYVEDAQPSPRLLPFTPGERAEARRLWQWAEESFAGINNTLLAERISQWVRREQAPNSTALRQGAHALKNRMTFLDALAGERAYLGGRNLTLADLSVAAHLSAYDYFGDVPWELTPDLKNWYARMKSRPAFRPLLADRVDGVKPVKHYSDLDF
ncbi:MAG: glutathione S-transferase family protein [Alphaproteobacteria bacterium]|jgi:glutathione S-transferase|nr:glutathione S-transferase family protein [Alphaproteobacteria bacterium]